MAVRSIEKFLNFAKGNHGFYKVLNQVGNQHQDNSQLAT